MLIFKKNIYEDDTRIPVQDADPGLAQLNIPGFLQNSLEETRRCLSTGGKAQEPPAPNELAGSFPRAHRFGDGAILQALCHNLLAGHLDPNAWYRMNSYHFCILYDSILRHGYNYNHQTGEEKLRQYPELSGKLLRVVQLVDRIFYNTGFLMDEDTFDVLTSLEKEEMGFNCPGLFGVVHGLAPAPDELELQRQQGYPYSIAV